LIVLATVATLGTISDSCLVIAYLPMPKKTSKLKATEVAALADPEMAARVVQAAGATRLARVRADAEVGGSITCVVDGSPFIGLCAFSQEAPHVRPPLTFRSAPPLIDNILATDLSRLYEEEPD